MHKQNIVTVSGVIGLSSPQKTGDGDCRTRTNRIISHFVVDSTGHVNSFQKKGTRAIAR